MIYSSIIPIFCSWVDRLWLVTSSSRWRTRYSCCSSSPLLSLVIQSILFLQIIFFSASNSLIMEMTTLIMESTLGHTMELIFALKSRREYYVLCIIFACDVGICFYLRHFVYKLPGNTYNNLLGPSILD